MKSKKQLWLLTGGNGAGKSTFYRVFLAPRGIKLVNADLIAKELDPSNPEKFSYKAAEIASRVMRDLLQEGVSLCYETVFSHESKIDFTAQAKGQGYEIILVYIHLESTELNEARVYQRVSEGGHNVPSDKIRNRIPRTMKNIAAVIPLADEVRILNNSSAGDPFRQVVLIKQGRKVFAQEPIPGWAEKLINDIP